MSFTVGQETPARKGGSFAAALFVMLLILGGLAMAGWHYAPREDGAIQWTASLVKGGWMAWTLATAMFFFIILALLLTMFVWERARPGGAPRVGLLGFETTRGDRLFITLLGSAWICIAWLWGFGTDASFDLSMAGIGEAGTRTPVHLWPGLALSFLWALFVFKFI